MVNYDNLNKMCEWEQEKALFIVQIAKKLGIDTSGYGELAVNITSGYTYLWLEDYNFTLYMPINCNLDKSDVWALHTDSENGNESEYQLKDDTTLEDLTQWANSCPQGE